MSHVQGGFGPGDPYLVRSHVQGGSLYGELQCITGNGHMGTDVPSRQTHTHTTENITFPQFRWRPLKTKQTDVMRYREYLHVHCLKKEPTLSYVFNHQSYFTISF